MRSYCQFCSRVTILQCRTTSQSQTYSNHKEQCLVERQESMEIITFTCQALRPLALFPLSSGNSLTLPTTIYILVMTLFLLPSLQSVLMLTQHIYYVCISLTGYGHVQHGRWVWLITGGGRADPLSRTRARSHLRCLVPCGTTKRNGHTAQAGW